VGTILSCPGCGALVHAEELKRLAARAGAAPPREALALWRSALSLLPRDSTQFKQVADKVETISRGLETNPQPAAKSGAGKWKGAAASGGVVLMLLAKFKTAIFLLLSQGKFLLLGLTKAGTLFSMFLSLQLYWQVYGWPLALGLIVCIYIHEMGHVFMLQRLGIDASAPMFIPGLGALIFLKQQHFSPREDARHGLAGPTWGLGASIAAALLGLALRSPVLLVIAQWNAWINLFNLTPVWSLDGARGFHALRRRERILAGIIFVAAWLPLLQHHSQGRWAPLLAMAAVVYGVVHQEEPQVSDRRAFWQYTGLCLVLAAFHWLPVPA
jgi:hypothetical protein